jgi:hypothetical protein
MAYPFLPQRAEFVPFKKLSGRREYSIWFVSDTSHSQFDSERLLQKSLTDVIKNSEFIKLFVQIVAQYIYLAKFDNVVLSLPHTGGTRFNAGT